MLRYQRLEREIGANCKSIVFLFTLLATRKETNKKKIESDLEALEEPRVNC